MEKSENAAGKPHWKCGGCGYVLQDDAPPDQCPSCQEKCEFADVSCYAPECGFKGVDPRL